MTPSRSVVVVGSANLDVVVSMDRFARPGETVLGTRLEEVAGGKGLNQAVAAARSSPCAFVGAVGDDDAGAILLDALTAATVDTSHVVRLPSRSGRALIQVTPGGENSIVVLALANQLLDADPVRRALDDLRPAVVLAQLEIPLATVQAAAAWAAASDARFVLNASPAQALPPSLIRLCDPLVVNTDEAAALLRDTGPGVPAEGERDAHELAARLGERAASVAVTDGERGVHVGTVSSGVTHVPGRHVAAVDTTGAGDEFAGALAAALARGLDLRAAAEGANQAAARVVALPRSAR